MVQKCLGIILIVFLYIGSQSAFSQSYKVDTARISDIVKKWNSAHNEMSKSGFYKLYASTVLFYTKQLDKRVCIEKKISLLHQQPFNQKIADDLKLLFYEDGTVYCGFTKEVKIENHKQSYPSYLLLKRTGARYFITGESDLITDRRLKFHLSLGVQIPLSELVITTDLDDEPTAQQNQTDYLTLILIGVPLIVVALVMIFLFKNRAKERSNPAPTEVIASQSKPIAKPQRQDKPKFAKAPNEAARQVDVEKGLTFEKFVIERFRVKSDFFKWTDATSDKGTAGYFPESNMNPDLQYEFRMNGNSYAFSVECKFRSVTTGQIQITKDGQLERYKRFSDEKGMEVFIVLGLGGKPDKPKDLFVIPLGEVKPIMHRGSLNPYKAHSSFYYNVEERRLY